MHHEIHEGEHFYICGHQTFGNGAVVDFTVITPAGTKWIHMTFEISGTGATSVEVHEAATVDAAGSAVVVQNNNRNSLNTSVTTVRTGDTFTGEGTMIFTAQAGANKETGFITREKELILKAGTTYIFRITNETAQDNEVTYCGEWYEHTNE